MPAKIISSKNIHVTVEPDAIHARVDSRLVAKAVGIEHKHLKQRIQRHIKTGAISPERRVQSAKLNDASSVIKKAQGQGVEAYYLLSFTEVQYLAATGRKRESVEVWQQMAAKVERAMRNASQKALKDTWQYQGRVEQQHRVNDAIKDHYIPLIESQKPTSAYLRAGQPSPYSQFAKLIKTDDSPRGHAMAQIALGDIELIVQRGSQAGGDYKALYRIASEDVGAFYARHVD